MVDAEGNILFRPTNRFTTPNLPKFLIKSTLQDCLEDVIEELLAEIQEAVGNREALSEVDIEDYLTQQGFLVPAEEVLKDCPPNIYET